MITVEEATQLVADNLLTLPTEIVRLGDAIGRALAEPVFADRDLPPFDRVTMDGIAIQAGSFQNGIRTFSIQSTQAAGMPAQTLSSNRHGIEVMTGAWLPINSDAIVPYEMIDFQAAEATVRAETVISFQNIHSRGQDARSGDVLLTHGTKLSPAEIAVLASVGKHKVSVFQLPRVAIISTGDELVDVSDTPLPHQIRRSNDWALHAALKEMHIASKVFHFADDRDHLEKQLAKVFEQADVVLLSGGVSKGKYDFVPDVLNSLGIEKVFHQVSQRPGKPFWFGRSARHRVFALPGNPVSTYLCFYRYVKPWLMLCQQQAAKKEQAVLARDFSFTPSLTYFLQVGVAIEKGVLTAYPRAGGGSGDFANLKEVDGFLELPKGKNEFRAGEVFDYYSFRK